MKQKGNNCSRWKILNREINMLKQLFDIFLTGIIKNFNTFLMKKIAFTQNLMFHNIILTAKLCQALPTWEFTCCITNFCWSTNQLQGLLLSSLKKGFRFLDTLTLSRRHCPKTEVSLSKPSLQHFYSSLLLFPLREQIPLHLQKCWTCVIVLRKGHFPLLMEKDYWPLLFPIY